MGGPTPFPTPEAAFRKGRSAVLEGFLGQGALYHTADLSERFEVSAGENISRVLGKLSEG